MGNNSQDVVSGKTPRKVIYYTFERSLTELHLQTKDKSSSKQYTKKMTKRKLFANGLMKGNPCEIKDTPRTSNYRNKRFLQLRELLLQQLHIKYF